MTSSLVRQLRLYAGSGFAPPQLLDEAAAALEQAEKALRKIAEPDDEDAAWYGEDQKIAREALAALGGQDKQEGEAAG